MTLDPFRALAAVDAIAARSGRKGPRRTVEETLDTLEDRYAMRQAVASLRHARSHERMLHEE